MNRRKRELNAPVLQGEPLHMVFKGNPGSGKTMVARKLAKLLHMSKVVQSSSVVEVQRGDLVAGYIGQTAIKTREKIEEAKGGVLFVDEAYRLSNAGSSNDFGKEAIEEIMRDLTTGDPLVIMAGYSEDMDKFLKTNAGLKRRFPLVFDFPDYSPSELAELFTRKAAGKGFKLGESISQEALAYLIEDQTTESWRQKRNGGIADLLLNNAYTALNERMPEQFTKEAASTFELLDLRAAVESLMTGQ